MSVYSERTLSRDAHTAFHICTPALTYADSSPIHTARQGGEEVRRVGCFILLIMLLASPAIAAPLVAVETVFGQDTGTLDASSGLVWLDINLTTGKSFDSIVADPVFARWRHASEDEVIRLLTSFDLTVRDGENRVVLASQPEFAPVRERFLALGTVIGYSWAAEMTGTQLGFNRLISGFTGDVMAHDAAYIDAVYLQYFDYAESPSPDDAIWLSANIGYRKDVARTHVGHWLVQPAPATVVPEPGTLALVSFGAAALGRRFRRR